MKDETLFICLAYEAGFGKADRDVRNPYVEDGDEYDAWAFGKGEGERRRVESLAMEREQLRFTLAAAQAAQIALQTACNDQARLVFETKKRIAEATKEHAPDKLTGKNAE